MLENNLAFFIALILTISIEVPIGLFFGLRKKTEISAIILVNVITNPLLNYLIYITRVFTTFNINIVEIILLELVVVLVEWRLLLFSLRLNQKKLLILSFFMNLFSFLMGILV